MLYYTHVNEDNAVELEALSAMPARELYVVGGSGERVLALLDHAPLQRVYIIDLNPHALYLCELKINALKIFPVEDYLRFTGVYEGTDTERTKQFERLSPTLSEPCRLYWQAHPGDIANGVCNCGHFERFLAKARPLLRFFLGASFYQCLVKPRSECRGFPKWRWALVRWFFTRRFTYRLFGMQDQAFISDNAALELIPAAMQQSIEENQVQQSCLFHLVLNGHIRDMPEALRPPSFQADRLRRMQTKLHTLELSYHEGDITEVLGHLPFQEPCTRFFSLSDVLSFISKADMKALLRRIAEIPHGQNRAVFRTFVRNRLGPTDLQDFGAVTDLSASERTHFYQVFQMDFHHASKRSKG